MALYGVSDDSKHILLLSLSDIAKQFAKSETARPSGSENWSYSDWFNWVEYEQQAFVQFVDDKGTPYYLYNLSQRKFSDLESADPAEE